MISGAAVIDDPLEQARFTRWNGQRDVAESSLRISGMHCASCALTIESTLKRMPGVLDASVNAASQTASVRWETRRTRPSLWVTALHNVGYLAVPDTAAATRAQRGVERRLMLWRFFVAAFCSMQIMMLAAPAYFTRDGELPRDQAQLLAWGQWLLCLPVVIFSAAPFQQGAWRALRQRRMGMDVPVALGIVVAFGASSMAALGPHGVNGAGVYFDSLTMFVSFLLGGRLLEMLARHRAEAQLEDTAQGLPTAAQRVRADGSIEWLSPQALRVGDIVRVPMGQAFSADGMLIRGRTEVDESLLTGESRPVRRGVGERVAAGSINLGAPVDMHVESCGADTRQQMIASLMREARAQRPDLGRVADRWAAPFLWAVLLLATAAAGAWAVIDPARAVWVFVSVLIVTCPCALSLAVPSALLSATNHLARQGVLVRRLDALEPLARASQLFVDKTGTLSEAQLACTHEELLDAQADPAQLRAVAISLAAWSHHPLARALLDLRAPACPEHWDDLREEPGAGMEARDEQRRVWRLGSALWVGAPASAGGSSSTWLSCDGRLLARFDFGEQLRMDSRSVLVDLEHLGLQATMLSGDTAERALAASQRLGLRQYQGAVSPEQKLLALREAQARGEVTVAVGDGVNDAPLLAQADVAVAMGEGADLARSQADLILLAPSLAGLATAIRLSRRTLRVIRQNFVWAAAYNLACIPLALAGWLPPWAAGLGMACSSLVVVLNSLRLTR